MKTIFYLSLLVVSASAMADSVDSLCSKSAENCTCATNILKVSVPEDDYALYENIGAAYIANMDQGMGPGDAWDSAVTAEEKQRNSAFIEVLDKTNSIGNTHRRRLNPVRNNALSLARLL